MASFDKLSSCEPQVLYESVHPIENTALFMLLKDSLRSYSFLTISIFHMIGMKVVRNVGRINEHLVI